MNDLATTQPATHDAVHDREILEMRHVEGISLQEAAQQLSIPTRLRRSDISERYNDFAMSPISRYKLPSASELKASELVRRVLVSHDRSRSLP